MELRPKAEVRTSSLSAATQTPVEEMVVLATLTLRRDMSATFTPSASIPYQEYIASQHKAPLQITETPGAVIMENVSFGGGSSIIIQLPDNTEYIVTVHRDAGAPRYPNTLDILGGTVNTANPIEASVREAFEEVVVLYDGKAIVPRFSTMPWSAQNGLISATVMNIGQKLGISAFTEREGGAVQLQNPFYLNGDADFSVGFGSEGLKHHPRPAGVHILLPPPVIMLDSIGAFRESIAIETKGKVPERDVVLIKLNGHNDAMPTVMVYNKGAEIGQYGTLEAYFSSGQPIKISFTPALASLLSYIGKGEFVDPNQYNQTFSESLRS